MKVTKSNKLFYEFTTSRNIDRFSKFFHLNIQQYITNKVIIKKPATFTF